YNEGSGSGSATVTVSASTLSGNSETGIDNNGFGGGNATVTVNASTLSGNSSSQGSAGGIGNDGTLDIGDTILNAGASGANITGMGTVTSRGYNLSSDDGGGFLSATGDQTNTDPILGPLQNN